MDRDKNATKFSVSTVVLPFYIPCPSQMEPPLGTSSRHRIVSNPSQSFRRPGPKKANLTYVCHKRDHSQMLDQSSEFLLVC